ncbi:MAG TPA: hypothetical protein VN841_25685 [Bryobacteraceae bacterium]|nr:hypothetical protein [Bryobacteraceae bacterium]
MPDRPTEMLTGDREPLQEFDPDELGYCRVHPDVVQSDDMVDPANVQCPDFSSNRSKLSLSHYVLYPRAQYGSYAVFKFFYREILASVSSPDASGGTPVNYAVKTLHDPEADNYGHCETRLYRGDQRMAPNKVSKGAKKLFREHMSRILALERAAGIPFP